MEEVFIILIGAGALAALGFFIANIANSEGHEAIPTEELNARVLLAPDNLYDVGFWRQSGDLHRTGGTGVSREDAIKEVKTAFNRAGIELFRFGTNNADEMDAWRAVHHGKGTRESRRLAGASIKRVLLQDEPKEAFLDRWNTPVTIEATTEAEKAIVKAYFWFVEQADTIDQPFEVPDDISMNFNAETGEGRALLQREDLLLFLQASQSYLSATTQLTNEVREGLRAGGVAWQVSLAENQEIEKILGVHGFGGTTPKEVQRAFRNWVEKYVGDDELSLDELGLGMSTFMPFLNSDLSPVFRS